MTPTFQRGLIRYKMARWFVQGHKASQRLGWHFNLFLPGSKDRVLNQCQHWFHFSHSPNSLWPQSPWTCRAFCSSRESEVKLLVTQLCLTLCDPMDYSPHGSSVHGIFQARILEWVTISGDLPDPGIKLRSPALEADSLPSEPPEKPWPLNVQFSAQMPPPQRNPVTPLTWA